MRMKEHVIVKYNPMYYDRNGVYTKDEWTSFCDIGKVFDGERFSLDEYTKVETNYIEFILECLRLTDCDYLSIDWNWGYEKKFFRYIIKNETYKFDPNFDESKCLSLICKIENQKRVSIHNAIFFIKLMLRESFNVCFYNKKKKIKFYMGYEYYLHFFTCLNKDVVKGIAEKYNLYLVW